MPAPTNPFKAGLKGDSPMIGFWLSLASPYTAEIAGGAGFDWVLLDGEHGPNDIPLLLSQLQALAALPVAPVVRVPIGETWMIKQVLDIGAQSVLVPMVESAAEARQLVKAMNYPPRGVRGVGAAVARASAFNRIPDYLTTANDEICLIVQAESRAAVDAIEEIAAVDGVDAIFIGPADLAADMGYPGRAGEPVVLETIEKAITRIKAAGKPAGILNSDPKLANRYIELGAKFVAVGTDVTLFAQATANLARSFKGGPEGGPTKSSSSY
jgi:4-hydroxy-2-oxoheptanedioate aldolase